MEQARGLTAQPRENVMSSFFALTPVGTPQSAAEALQGCGVPALRTIVVEERNELLILQGRLPSYYLKQLAQETVLPFLAGRTIENKIVVIQH
jgi:hypothetical protein